METLVFPYIGSRPVAKLTASDVLKVLKRIEGRGTHETAHRTRQRCSQVFRYAVQTERAERDVTADLRGALAPVISEHHAAITEPARVGELLRAIDGYAGHGVTAYALKLAPLLFVRPGEFRHYVFPSLRGGSRPMSENTVNAALRRLGYTGDEMTGHGFRSLASTNLNEQGYHPDLIELQLAHAERNKVRAAYNKAQRLPERRKMMQSWAEYLDGLRGNANVVPIKHLVG